MKFFGKLRTKITQQEKGEEEEKLSLMQASQSSVPQSCEACKDELKKQIALVNLMLTQLQQIPPKVTKQILDLSKEGYLGLAKIKADEKIFTDIVNINTFIKRLLDVKDYFNKPPAYKDQAFLSEFESSKNKYTTEITWALFNYDKVYEFSKYVLEMVLNPPVQVATPVYCR